MGITDTDGLRVVRHVPGTRRQWVVATAQVSGLLLSVRAAENAARADPPEPLRGGRALRAWGRVARALLDRPGAGDLAVPATVRVSDLDDIAAAGTELGTRWCGALGGGAADRLVDLLRREAAVYLVSPESLVAQIARVHGVLTIDDPATAGLVWDAGAG